MGDFFGVKGIKLKNIRKNEDAEEKYHNIALQQRDIIKRQAEKIVTLQKENESLREIINKKGEQK